MDGPEFHKKAHIKNEECVTGTGKMRIPSCSIGGSAEDKIIYQFQSSSSSFDRIGDGDGTGEGVGIRTSPRLLLLSSELSSSKRDTALGEGTGERPGVDDTRGDGTGSGVVGVESAEKIDWDTSERSREARFCDFVNVSPR